MTDLRSVVRAFAAPALAIAVSLSAAACAEPSAPVSSEPVTLQTEAERQAARIASQSARASATASADSTEVPGEVTAESPPESTSNDDLREIEESAVAEPAVEAEGSESTSSNPDDESPTPEPIESGSSIPATGGLPLSAAGQALGCTDAFDLREKLRQSTPAVAEAVSPMRRDLWLCLSTPEVDAALTCYYDATAAVLDALESAAGAEGSDIVEQIRGSNAVFCGSGDVLDLSLGALLERAEP